MSDCYAQLLFRYYYRIGSSVDYQGPVLFRGFTFNTVFIALAAQKNWSDSFCLLFMILYVMNESYYIKYFFWQWSLVIRTFLVANLVNNKYQYDRDYFEDKWFLSSWRSLLQFLPYIFSMSGHFWKSFRICLLMQLWFTLCDSILE